MVFLDESYYFIIIIGKRFFIRYSIKNNLSIFKCRCGGALEVINSKAICKKCSLSYKIIGDGSCLLFEEVYSAENPSISPIKLTDNELKKSGNWRIQNYKISKEWLKRFSSQDLIVDLGCGRLINQELMKDKRTLYVDGAKFDEINLVCDFSKTIPLRSNVVDAVFCSNVFEHLPEPQICLNEIYRVLKPKGECLILVPFFIKLHQEPFDFHRYTKYALEFYAKNAGFQSPKAKEVGGFSNILGTVLKTGISNTSNPIVRLGLKIQYFIWRILRKIFDDDEPNKIYPQGYALYLKK